MRPQNNTKHLVVSVGGLELLRIFKAHLKLELSNFPHARAEHAGVDFSQPGLGHQRLGFHV